MFAFLRENMLSLQGINMKALGKAEISLALHFQSIFTVLYSKSEGRRPPIRILECCACADGTHLHAAAIWHWPTQPGVTDFKFIVSKCCIPKKVFSIFLEGQSILDFFQSRNKTSVTSYLQLVSYPIYFTNSYGTCSSNSTDLLESANHRAQKLRPNTSSSC